MTLKESKSLDKASDKILSETNYWLMRIKAGKMTESSEIKFHKWLAADHRHQARFELMNAIWDGADSFLKDPQVLEDLNESVRPETGCPKKGRWPGSHAILPFRRLITITASVVMVVFAAWMIHFYKELPTRYQTGTGSQQMLDLADGSRIYLDSETEISVRMSNHIRRIELQKGRAMFLVAHDPERPFTVDAGKISVRALGTEFNVYRTNGEKISVAVTEGSVQVRRLQPGQMPSPDPAPDETDLSPVSDGQEKSTAWGKNRIPLSETVLVSGQAMIFNKQNACYEIHPVDRERVNSWRDGRLYFYMTPLSEVIDEVNRYLNNKILIGDSSLNELPISLNFDIKHRDSFLPTLVSAMKIRAQKTGSGRYILLQNP